MVTQIENANDFEQILRKPNLIIVHFCADFVEQCQMVTNYLKEISEKTDIKKAKVLFYNCPAEELSEISLKYQIEAVPTILYFQNGKLLDRVNGTNLSKIWDKLLELSKVSNTPSTEPKKSLNERLKDLINQHQVMVFMKGNREQPRCGFSKQLMAILNETGVEFKTFDILQDEEVRQGLKTYSDWPTYPQLYVKGELIGGLDIVKELQAGNELLPTLNG